ncbi:glycoside hydrolase family 95-like protein [Alicyclobacillus sacchari]|uniref:glycoside hydrolase family 95-like protein n=1 Tax=Alicyclobacillus sacchari TaxID=392010 RepID=UPI00312CA979
MVDADGGAGRTLGFCALAFASHVKTQAAASISGGEGVIAPKTILPSHQGGIHVLPALPKGWPDGSVCGLGCRGGIRVGCPSARRSLRCQARLRTPGLVVFLSLDTVEEKRPFARLIELANWPRLSFVPGTRFRWRSR